jgi:hypothetical protein
LSKRGQSGFHPDRHRVLVNAALRNGTLSEAHGCHPAPLIGSSALLVKPVHLPEASAAEPGRFFYDGKSHTTLTGTAIGEE